VSSFARFDDYKGATDFVRAVAILRDRGTRVTAWLCGPSGTSDRTAAEVLALVDRLGLGPLVRLPGYVSAAERCHLLSMSVALVHPARRESFGLAIAEALAHGTPVVAAQSDGAALLLSEGGGRIVPAARPDAIACAIEALVRDPREHERLGREGRTAVARNWDITTMLERIRFVLRTALAGEGAVAES
jgi:glycosyltransferase involved in cell wall biosynthesis